MTGNPYMPPAKTSEWATPQALFDLLNSEFHFTLDPCATNENHKCEKYFTKTEDGLTKNWGGADSVLQSALRERDFGLGGESLQRKRLHGCYASSCENRHKMVSRLHLPESGNQIYPRPAALQRCKRYSTVSVNDRSFQE